MTTDIVPAVKTGSRRRFLTEEEKRGIIASPGFPVMCSRQPQQNKAELFVVEYCKDQSGVGAWRRTVFPQEVSDGVARARGSEWLKIPEIGQEIKRRLQGRLTLADITPERIKAELARLAFSDVGKLTKLMPVTDAQGNQLIGDDGQPVTYEVAKDLSEIDEDTRRSISAVEFKHGGKNLKLADKQAALNTLARIGGMVIDRKALSADLGSSAMPVDPVDEELDDVIEMSMVGDVGQMLEEAMSSEEDDQDDE